MTAIWMRFSSELRSRWRSWLGLALFIGMGAGASMAAGVGARRTETAYPRFVHAQNGYDLSFGLSDDSEPASDRALARAEALPEVRRWARVDVAAVGGVLPSGLRSATQLTALADRSGRFGYELNRFKVVSGRLADRDASSEAMVDFPTADRERLRVGDVIKFVVGDPDAVHAELAGVRIVGIIATPGRFPAVGVTSALNIGVIVTPAFVRSYNISPDPANATLAITLRRGVRDRDAFMRHLAGAGLAIVDPADQPVQTAAVQRSIRLESNALWALCALISVAACAVMGQALARETRLGSADFPTLSALGMSRAQLLVLGLFRAGAIGVVAACAAVPIAILLSPLTPIGLARIAEPHPGIFIDVLPLLVCALTIPLLTALVAAFPAWLSARTTRSASSVAARRERPSALGATLSKVFSSAPAMVGTRLALQPGRGPTAIPIRSAAFGATLSLAALTASLLFAASMGHLLETPRLSGYTWDAYVSVDDHEPQLAAALAADRNVGAVGRGGFQAIQVGRDSIPVLIFDETGPIHPVVTTGVAPLAADEIALGAATMRATHTTIGSTVDVSAVDVKSSSKPHLMRVVGTVITPPSPYAATTMGEGAALTLAGFHRIDARSTRNDQPFLVRFVRGLDPDAGLAAVAKDAKGLQPTVVRSERLASVSSLARIAVVPVLLAGSLAVLAAGSLSHALLSSARRRRRELAILKALGFDPGQLRRAIAWQAMTLVSGPLVVGLPVGLVGGRIGWRLFAQQLGVLPEAALPVTALLVTVASTPALAIVLSLAPGQAAARIKPGAVLTGE